MEFETRVFSCLVTRDDARDFGLIARATEKATDGPHLSGPLCANFLHITTTMIHSTLEPVVILQQQTIDYYTIRFLNIA